MPRGFADRSMRRRTAADRAVWPGAAFVVEALILLVFLAGCLAVFMQLFGDANETWRQNVQLEEAVELASNRAERFAADPLAGMGEPGEGGAYASADETDDGLTVICEVVPEPLSAGVLYRASIAVTADGEEVFSLATARYVAGAAGVADVQGGGANG